MEKQPTEEELEPAGERAQADADERFACESSGRPYEDTLGRLRKA